MYHMSEDIKVDFIDNDAFVDRHWTPAFGARFVIKKLNENYGIFNKKCFNHILGDALFPKKTRDRWVEYLNQQDYDIIITTAALSLRLGMIAPGLNAKTIGWQHNCYSGYVDVPKVVLSGNRSACFRNICHSLTVILCLATMINGITRNSLGSITEVKINPRSFVSEKKCNPDAKRFLDGYPFCICKRT